jgi:predicted ribosome quality control (RQC) complex YloA/Tae2 family protein
MNSLEILFQVKKLKEVLVSSKIQKVKQISKNAFSFELYKQKKHNYLILSNELFFISEKSYEADLLTNLGQILRKHLTGQIIQDIRQYEFDRIVEIETKDYLLILELFGNGNIILLSKDRTIITALEMRSWKDRSLRPKVVYKYPPSRINPFKLSQNELKECFKDKEVIKVLATDLGFGGDLAENICKKLGIDKKSKSIDTSKLYFFIKTIEKEFENLNKIKERLKEEFEKGYETKKEVNEVKDKLERIKKKQEEALKKWQEKENEFRKIGKLLYENYEEVKKKLDSYIKKITIDDLSIDLDPKKTVQKNAEIYFEKAKKAKRKIEGLIKTMKQFEEKKLVKVDKETTEERKREWYDNFRWIKSSDDFLLIGGKDAKTNEQLIRKHMKDSDLVFHTDITGSPFVLIKNPEKKEIPEQTIKEAAEFCGSYSKAWKVGISAVDVYYIKSDQVKKEGGLPTGSFMIYGKREWVRRIPVKVAIGIKDNWIIFGPEDMVKNKVSKYVQVIPGNDQAYEVAKEIQKILKTKIELERITKIIPYGKGRLIG